MKDWFRFRNTYLQLPWLFPLVIGNRQYDNVLEGRRRNFGDKVQRALERLIWFWPRVIDAAIWAAGGADKRQTPLNYAKIDDDAVRLLDWVERVCPDRSAPILDLGCNCGRHLAHLAGRGYQNLTGVDAMREAISYFEARVPELYRSMKVHHDLFQRFLLKQPERCFDVTYSHGATIELVHPSFDIVRFIARATDRFICLILVESEGYRRDWLRQFENHGFVLFHGERPMHPGSNASLIVLRRSDIA